MDNTGLYINFIKKNIDGILPSTVEKDSDYFPKLKDLLSIYIDAVDKEPLLDDCKEDIKCLVKSLERSIDLYYEGKTAAAYEEIKDFTDRFSGFEKCKKQMQDVAGGYEYTTLYRGRVAEEINNLTEMFHRPFSQRPYIPTERFSIPGLPCLYLAGSVYTCWREIGKPNFNEFFVSRFQTEEDVTILDLAMQPCNSSFTEDEQKDYCIIWPLICACSYKVREKIEYFVQNISFHNY